jgi:hypothetical protein
MALLFDQHYTSNWMPNLFLIGGPEDKTKKKYINGDRRCTCAAFAISVLLDPNIAQLRKNILDCKKN